MLEGEVVFPMFFYILLLLCCFLVIAETICETIMYFLSKASNFGYTNYSHKTVCIL